MFEYTKGKIGSPKPKKDRQYHDRKKKDKQRYTKKTKIHIKLNIKYSKSTKNVGWIHALREESGSCSTNGTSRYSSYKPGDKSTKNRGGTHVFWKDKQFLLH
jgi:hypothetical protein